MSFDYPGPERRRRVMYVTANTEYHFRDGTCVAVRDRGTGRFVQAHLALGRRFAGAVRFSRDGSVVPSTQEPAPGAALYFGPEGRELVTSRLVSVGRPSKQLVQTYPD